jgi:hypothetical protein
MIYFGQFASRRLGIGRLVPQLDRRRTRPHRPQPESRPDPVSDSCRVLDRVSVRLLRNSFAVRKRHFRIGDDGAHRGTIVFSHSGKSKTDSKVYQFLDLRT